MHPSLQVSYRNQCTPTFKERFYCQGNADRLESTVRVEALSSGRFYKDFMQKLICVPITETKAEAFLQAMTEAANVADIIELRLDYLEADELVKLLSTLPSHDATKPLLFTFRPREQGGRRDLSLMDRLSFWRGLSNEIKARIAYADFELDLVEYLANQTPPLPWSKIICSHHNFDETPANLNEIYERIARTPAAVIKIATKANRIADCLPLFDLMGRGEKPVIVLGMGLPGVATRILTLSRGAMLTFGALRRGAESASGQPTATELRELYRAPQLTSQSEIYGVIGNPIGHSRSPLIHNAALKATGRDGVYLPFEVDDAAEFIRDFVHPKTKKLDWNLRGLSVTIPHKLSLMPHLDFISPAAEAVGAVNTIIVNGDELHGDNTDVIGAMKPLEELLAIRGTRAAIIGAGGAARAICYGLQQRGANVTIYARDLHKAQRLANEFKASAAAIADFQGNTDLVINCTPVGMQGHHEGTSPVKAESLHNVRLVYDLIYNPLETQLLKDAKAAGAQTLGGMAMLLGQAAEQFRLWTGDTAPLNVMCQAINSY
jgi:3-dehydroquinate dehydratase/shikimate dehydrogenase